MNAPRPSNSTSILSSSLKSRVLPFETKAPARTQEMRRSGGGGHKRDLAHRADAHGAVTVLAPPIAMAITNELRQRTHRAADDELAGLQGTAALVEVVDTPRQARHRAALGVLTAVACAGWTITQADIPVSQAGIPVSQAGIPVSLSVRHTPHPAHEASVQNNMDITSMNVATPFLPLHWMFAPQERPLPRRRRRHHVLLAPNRNSRCN